MDGARKLMGFDWQYGVADVPARDAFSCRGENETEFYRQDARRYSHIGAACVVTVWADDSHDKVAGFVSYAPSAINADRPKAAEWAASRAYAFVTTIYINHARLDLYQGISRYPL